MRALRSRTAAALLVLFACGGSHDGGAFPDAATPGADSAARTMPGPDGGGPDAASTDAGAPGDAGVPPAFGANVTPLGVQFRVWAPHATAATVVGDFPEQRVPMLPEPGGIFKVLVPDAHAGTIYHFSFQTPGGAIDRLDPYCRQVLPDASGCTVIDPTAYAWKSGAFTRPARNASVVYELHVPSFSVATGAAQGTLAQAATRLPDLADLGVSVVELMPVQDFGGSSAGWGYNPQLFFTPKPGIGTSDDLRAFVDAAHALGIAVWLDVVINHCDGWRQAPLACYDGTCPNGSHGVMFFPPGPWATTPYGPRPDYSNPEVASMLLASATSWLGELRGDGFRWDSVSNIRGNDGNGVAPGGKELLVALNDLTHAAGGTSIAEDLKGWAAITQSTSTGGFGFDAQWDGFGYDVTGVLTSGSDDARDMGAIQGALTGDYGGDPFARLMYLENHDIVGNGGARLPARIDPVNPTSYYARKRSMLGALLLLTAPGIPMLFMGEEALATAGFPNPPAPLPAPTAQGLLVRAFYKDAIALRENRGGQAGGLLDAGVDVLHRDDTGKVIAYRRRGPSGQDVIVALNFRNTALTGYTIGVPSAGPWRIRLDSDWKAYGTDFGGGQMGALPTSQPGADGQPYALTLALGPYSGVVLSR